MKTPFLGVAYQARSSNLACQRLINLYLETVEGPGGSAPGAFMSCPSLDVALTFATSGVRQAVVVGNLLYVIAGNTCYSVTSALVATALGTIGTSSGAAYITTNGMQIGFWHSGGLSVLTLATATFASVVLPYAGTVGVPAQQDTLCLLTQPGTYNIWQSDINDLTTWDPLNFTTEDGNAQPVVSLVAIHDQVIVFKTDSMCFYVNEGNAGFVYGRLSGLYPAVGCAVAASVTVLNEKVFWIGHTSTGQSVIYMIQGYQPERVSSYAIENTINAYSTISDAQGFGYTQEGHGFVIFNFPTGGQTWVFDYKETERLKLPVWHERAGFSGGFFTNYDGQCSVRFGGTIYMGSPSSGALYALDLTTALGPLDAGMPRKILRSWQQDKESDYPAEKCNYLDFQMDTGLGVPLASNPQLVLRQSFDGGETWTAEQYVPIGGTGATNQTVRFRRLGATRRGLNEFRIFEMSSTDRFQATLMAADAG